MKKSFCFTLMILFLAACGNSQPQQEESGASHQTMVISRSDIALEQLDPQRFMRVNRQKNAALGSFPNASFLPIWKYPGDRWQT